jgi:hypothetical protein
MNQGNLVSNFLKARMLIDTKPIEPAPKTNAKPERTINKDQMDVGMGTLSYIISKKPKNKVVMDFLKQKVSDMIDSDSE